MFGRIRSWSHTFLYICIISLHVCVHRQLTKYLKEPSEDLPLSFFFSFSSISILSSYICVCVYNMYVYRYIHIYYIFIFPNKFVSIYHSYALVLICVMREGWIYVWYLNVGVTNLITGPNSSLVVVIQLFSGDPAILPTKGKVFFQTPWHWLLQYDFYFLAERIRA